MKWNRLINEIWVDVFFLSLFFSLFFFFRSFFLFFYFLNVTDLGPSTPSHTREPYMNYTEKGKDEHLFAGSTGSREQGWERELEQGKNLHIKDESRLRFGGILIAVPEGLVSVSQVTCRRNSGGRTHGVVLHGQEIHRPSFKRELLPVGALSPSTHEHGFGGIYIYSIELLPSPHFFLCLFSSFIVEKRMEALNQTESQHNLHLWSHCVLCSQSPRGLLRLVSWWHQLSLSLGTTRLP